MFISSGSALLNLALSDQADGGYETGKILNLIGDSSAGKTALALTMLAECANNPEFDEYELILDDVEAALEFDVENIFGNKLSERLTWKGVDEASDTVYDFYGNVLKLLNENKKFIYVLDSLDALTTLEDKERGDEIVKGKDPSGSFKTEKPKALSEILRNLIQRLSKTDSFLVIISQTRDNLGFGAQFTPKLRSGGRALKFYSSYEVWLALKGQIKSCERITGNVIQAKVTKNKYTGKIREAEFPLYYDYGLDDLGSCVDFLVTEKVWNNAKKSIDAGEWGTMTQSKLIQHIEENALQNKVKSLVQDKWLEIEEKIKLKRLKKYT
jgi:RecA/RadA recombinase